MRGAGVIAAAALLAAAAANTVEIKGRVTNQLDSAQYRQVEIVVTDRLGVELGRARADARGRYELKISGPRYVILKAALEGYPQAIYQIDTQEIKESTEDREENRVFAELRTPTYFQNITFGATGGAGTLEDLLAKEDPAAVKAYREARGRKETGALEKVVEKYPGFYIGYIDLGMMLAAQGQNDRAIEVFTKAGKLRPEHSWLYIGLGVALNNKQDYKAAAGYLEKAVALEPNPVNGLFQLGMASFKLGAQERAQQCFERVAELEPKFNPLVYKTLASIYVSRQNPRGAARALQTYLAQFPDAPDAEKVKQILVKLGQ